jgi:glycosyltransferase involved in cell wall biosynthesis
MRILLLGEYSRLHNSLKEGLQKLGHEVILVSNGDGFKNYPADYSIRPKLSSGKLVNFFRQIIYKIFRFDVAKLEQGIRFYLLLNQLKGFDVVQLINERPIKTTSSLELFLLKKIFKNNKKVFLLCCGTDYLIVKSLLERKLEKSILNPYFEDNSLKNDYKYVFEYTKKSHFKIHNFIYQNCVGIIASDMDYYLPMKDDAKFLGLIPNPINSTVLEHHEIQINSKIVIFLGINQWNAIQKGIVYFEKAIEIIKNKYPDKVEIIIAKNIPYQEYINLYNKAHILLDQCFAYDQGYNALEAMAKGKVVFTGAEKEFLLNYNLQEDEVAINAKPDVDYLVEKLSMLIENPEKINQISKNARAFIEKEHDYMKIAKRYLFAWGNKVIMK